MSIVERIPDLDTFLAFSITLEEEAAERHDELADVMETHNNLGVAAAFRKLAHFSRLHAAEVRALAAGRALPRIAPWEFDWEDMEAPETTDPALVDYLMSTRRALEIAMSNERRAHDFYHALGMQGRSDDIRSTAMEFASEEQEHVELLQRWLDRLADDDGPRHDPDPPHMPE